MTDHTHPPHLPLHRGRGLGTRAILILVVGALLGVAAGVYFHEPIGRWIGLGAGTGAPETGAKAPATLWTCSMHPQVIQDHPGLCPICHMELTPLKAEAGKAAASGGDAAPRRIKYWWDPMMNPPYTSDKPGKSPMGMDLVPMYADETPEVSGLVTIDPVVVQNMGVRTATVSEGPLHRSIRLVGYLDEAQPNMRDVNLLVSGWVRRLYADTEGMRLAAGDPLFDLYSPELRVAVEELIMARRARGEVQPGAEAAAHQSAAALYDAVAAKLALWGLARAQIEALAKLDRAPETVTFTSPIAGDLTEKAVVEGAAVKAGDRVLRIVDHTTLWLDAQVFDQQLPFVKVGQKATATVAGRPGETLRGEIIFIQPRVDAATRAATVRLAIPNASLALRPGMYATVRVQAELSARAVLAPREAVIDTGERQIVFVAKPAGRFEPRRVVMGVQGDDGMVEVLQGLSPGETVVTSGQFLLDSESRLSEAVQKFLKQKPGAPTGPGPGATEPAPGGTGGRPAVPAMPAGGALTESVDSVVAAYLAISDALGAVQSAATPVDTRVLAGAAEGLHAVAPGTEYAAMAEEIGTAAAALGGKPLERQRALFKALSAAVVGLVEKAPPSRAVGERLYLIHCPMAPGDWLQRSEEVANPFYAASMKRCGELVRTIEASGGVGK